MEIDVNVFFSFVVWNNLRIYTYMKESFKIALNRGCLDVSVYENWKVASAFHMLNTPSFSGNNGDARQSITSTTESSTQLLITVTYLALDFQWFETNAVLY